MFEAECATVLEFQQLCNHMFSVFDGNHCLYAWTLVAYEHPNVEQFHSLVISRFLRVKRKSMIKIEWAMHELNKWDRLTASDWTFNFGLMRTVEFWLDSIPLRWLECLTFLSQIWVVRSQEFLDLGQRLSLKQHDLSYYKKIIDPTSFKTFENQMANVKNEI